MFPKIVQIFSYWPIYLTLRFFCDFKIKGQENLKGLENKGVIFASNHGSYIDGPICAATIPRNKLKHFFPVRFLAASEFFSWNNPFPFPVSLFVSLYVRINGSIPVRKTGGKLHKSLSLAIKELKNKEKLWIYPEGKINRSKRIRSGKRGVAYLHKKTKAPIIPVGISGVYNLSFQRFIFRKNRIRIKIGRPIYSLEGMTLEQGVERVMGEIKRLRNG